MSWPQSIPPWGSRSLTAQSANRMSTTTLPPKPKSAVEKRTRTTVETIMITPEQVAKWKLPTGQRPLRVNEKVRELSGRIADDGGVLPGVLTIGILNKEWWIIDGQHRIHAFLLSCLKEGYTDVRFLHAESMAEINREFVELNSKLVGMRPDDFLRGMEGSIAALQEIRLKCPFVGYDMIRRNGNCGPVVSMSAVIKFWDGSRTDTPSYSGMTAIRIAEDIGEEEVRGLCNFLHLAMEAFGRDPEYRQLWIGLNMTICMWLYRNLVLRQYSPKSPRLSSDMFKKCLMSLSADSGYQNWLLGRRMGERDRAPAYTRIKQIFIKRLEQELNRKVMLPQPDWSTGA